MNYINITFIAALLGSIASSEAAVDKVIANEKTKDKLKSKVRSFVSLVAAPIIIEVHIMCTQCEELTLPHTSRITTVLASAPRQSTPPGYRRHCFTRYRSPRC